MRALFCFVVVEDSGLNHRGDAFLSLPDGGLTEEAVGHAREWVESRAATSLKVSRDSLSAFFTSVTKLDE